MSLLHVDAILAAGGAVSAGDLGAVLVGAHAAASTALECGFVVVLGLMGVVGGGLVLFGGVGW